MRCQVQHARDCPTAERCEIEGCRQPYGPPAQALVPERPQIPLDYQPGRLMRGLMALTDRGAVAVKRGPTPFAPALPAPEPPAMSATVPPAPAPEPLPLPAELRVVPISGGWIVYRGAIPAAVASDPASLGAHVAELVKR